MNFLTLSNVHKQNVVDKYITSRIILLSKVRPRPELVKKFPAFKQLELSSPRSQKVKVEIIGDPYFIYCNCSYSSNHRMMLLQINTKLHTVSSQPRHMGNVKKRF